MLLKHVPYLLVYSMHVQQVFDTTQGLYIHPEEAESNAMMNTHTATKSIVADGPWYGSPLKVAHSAQYRR